jgi:predicted porin
MTKKISLGDAKRAIGNVPLRAAVIATFALMANHAVADTNDELKDEITRQKARLEAMEKKLDATAESEQKLGINYTKGEGIGYHSPNLDLRLYGLLDLTAISINHTNATGDRKTSFQVGWFSGSRWGFNGRRSLGDAPDLIFRLEGEFEIPTGSLDTDNVIFNRDAWVGFKSDALGKLTFGRQNTVTRDFSQIYGDAYSPSNGAVNYEEGGWTNQNNFKQMIFYAGSVTGTRYDRGIVWKKELGGGFIGGLGFQFGDQKGKFSSNTTRAAALAYNGGRFNLSGFIDSASVRSNNPSTTGNLAHFSYSVGGDVKLGDITTLNAGYFYYRAGQPVNLGGRTDKSWTVSAKFAPQGRLDYEVGFERFTANNAALNGGGAILNPFKDTSTATATSSGRKKVVYGSVFYHFDKTTELYIAADYMNLSDGYKVASTGGHKNQTELAVGVRTRF